MSGVFSYLKSLGTFPPEYKASVHGPYNPAINYKVDAPLKDVKLGEMRVWMGRRNPNPIPFLSRSYWGFMQKWIWPKRAGSAGYVQVIMAASLYFYITTYSFTKCHRHCKYH